ncbi:solute carrier family 22 member 18 [Bufo gargarizans]|uniref:solute carrier family 22 member 18 n=1 Tax=Bufo gargarizans TaxID=30331 RepID=UPI001CF55CBA|nr:solute carrier family 22 member 18 [Bufo gargarizans]
MAADPGTSKSQGRVITVTYLLTAIDVSCLFMQFAVTPYLARSLGLDTVGFGYLQTVFGVLQLVGGPVFGRFSDQYGPRAALTLSFLSASLYYLILAFTTSIPFLFLSRVPSIFMHGLPGAQMIVTDLTTAQERAGALGKLGLCFGLGIIVGSSVGGYLATRFGLYTPTLIALAASLISCVIVMIYIPAQTKAKEEGRAPERGKPSVFNFGELVRLLKYPGVMAILIIKVLSGFPIGVFMLMFPIVSVDFFGLNAATAGYLMSYFGILQLVVQGFMVGRLTSRLSDDTLLLLSVVVAMIVGLGLVVMTNVYHFCIIAVPMVFTLCVSGVITDSILTKAVPPSETGAMLGICASIQPLTRTIGPTIGGYLYKHYGVPAFGLFDIIVSLLLLFYLVNRQTKQNAAKNN